MNNKLPKLEPVKQLSPEVILLLGYDPSKGDYPENFHLGLELLKTNSEESLSIQEMLGQTNSLSKLPTVSVDDFITSDHRKNQGRPYLLVNKQNAILTGFSYFKSFKRAIALQTIDCGFIPKPGFRPLEPGIDFEVKNGDPNLWVMPLVLTRVAWAKKSVFESDSGMTRRQVSAIKLASAIAFQVENINYFYYCHNEKVRERIVAVLGYSPGFNAPNPFWNEERETRRGVARISDTNDRQARVTAWFKERGLYIPSDEEIAAAREKMKANKVIRNQQRFAKIMKRVLAK